MVVPPPAPGGGLADPASAQPIRKKRVCCVLIHYDVRIRPAIDFDGVQDSRPRCAWWAFARVPVEKPRIGPLFTAVRFAFPFEDEREQRQWLSGAIPCREVKVFGGESEARFFQIPTVLVQSQSLEVRTDGIGELGGWLEVCDSDVDWRPTTG